jgi:hypothetical protein
MRITWSKTKRWKPIHTELGYLPHYQKCGRLLMEVKFVRCKEDRKFWTVINTVTGDVETFRQNGTPLNGSRGRLVGPLIHQRKVMVKAIVIKRRKKWL